MVDFIGQLNAGHDGPRSGGGERQDGAYDVCTMMQYITADRSVGCNQVLVHCIKSRLPAHCRLLQCQLST